MFPILFAVGKEGLGYLTMSQSVIGHCIADILSKNIWGVMEFMLEHRVHVRCGQQKALGAASCCCITHEILFAHRRRSLVMSDYC